MNDEACPEYSDIADNFMMGFHFLKEELDVVPRIGWALDTFGHSNTHAKILAELGMDALFFARLDYRDK